MTWILDEKQKAEIKNLQPLSERDLTTILSALNLRLSKTVAEWVLGREWDFDKLLAQIKLEIKETCELVGGKLPGGKTIGYHDMEGMMHHAMLTGLQLVGKAKMMRAKATPLVPVEVMKEAISSMDSAAVIKEKE
jgi:hypothetical protein